MSLIFRTVLDAFAELRGGRWVPGRCLQCRRRVLVQYRARRPVRLADGSVPRMHDTYRCRRCATDARAAAWLAPLRRRIRRRP